MINVSPPRLALCLGLAVLLPGMALAQANLFPVVGDGQTALEARMDMVAQARATCGSDRHAHITHIQIAPQPSGYYEVYAWVTCTGG